MLQKKNVYYQVNSRQIGHILLGDVFPDSSCSAPDVLKPVADRLVGARHTGDGCMIVQDGLVVVRHRSPHVVNSTNDHVRPLTQSHSVCFL